MIKRSLLAITHLSQLTFIRTARNIKPWNVGPKEYWNKGIYNYDWRKARGRKTSLPKGSDTFVEDYRAKEGDKLTKEETRSLYKEKGTAPPLQWNEEPLFVASSVMIFEPYVPPEGDGKASLLTLERSKQEGQRLTSKGKSMMAMKKIRSYLEFFDLPTFAPEALEIYIKAHQCLVDRDNEKIFDYVTEKCYPEITLNTECKTLRWQFIKTIEPPTVVHVRFIDGEDVGSQFAQVTVRLNTQQTLAIYDKFGRLMHGDEAVVKNVLEYIVFENQVSNIYGKWRIHGKIIPDWMPPRPSIPQTIVKPEIPDEKDIINPLAFGSRKKQDPKTATTTNNESGNLATA